MTSILCIEILSFWLRLVLKLDVIPQGSHLHIWHPYTSCINHPYSFSMEDKPHDSNKLQGRCATPVYRHDGDTGQSATAGVIFFHEESLLCALFYRCSKATPYFRIKVVNLGNSFLLCRWVHSPNAIRRLGWPKVSKYLVTPKVGLTPEL